MQRQAWWIAAACLFTAGIAMPSASQDNGTAQPPPQTSSDPPARTTQQKQPPTIKIPPKPGVIYPMILAYHPWKGLITLDGLVNGNNPARFIISTGLSYSTVAPNEVARLQLAATNTKTKVTVLDASAEVPSANIQALRLGAGILHDIPVAEINLMSLLTKEPLGDAPTCWLGNNWLSHYQVTMDFETHSVILNKAEAPFSKEAATVVPFKMKNGRPVVKVTVPGAGSFEAAIDTASVGTLIPEAIALKLKAKKTDKTPKTAVLVGDGRMARIIVPKIGIGKMELKNLMAAYYTAAAPASADKTMAVIGLDFLRRFRVTFSYYKQQMQIMLPQSLQLPDSDAPPPPKTAPQKPYR